MTQVYHADRRSLLKAGALAGTALAAGTSGAIAQLASSSRPTKGDVAILRFLSAIEQIESDLWQQYNELGGIHDSEEPPFGKGVCKGASCGNAAYTAPDYFWGGAGSYQSIHRRATRRNVMTVRMCQHGNTAAGSDGLITGIF